MEPKVFSALVSVLNSLEIDDCQAFVSKVFIVFVLNMHVFKKY